MDARSGGQGPETAGARRLSTTISPPPSLAAILGALRTSLEDQAQRWFLWAPVAFALGAAGYLTLKSEPPAWAIFGPALLAIAAATLLRRRIESRLVLIVVTLAAFGVAGAAAGKLRTLAVAAPVAPAAEAQRRVDGYVVDVTSSASGGGRLIIAPVRIRSLSPDQTPKRIRVTIPVEAIRRPGEAISLLAFVGPPPPPAAPGAYDFARDSYFDAVGGVGFANTAIEPAELGLAPWRLRLVMAVNVMRWDLARRIVDATGAETGGVAAAMVTGHEVWLTQTQVADMRASGLAHILSISGLHMAIVGGFVFALARMLIAVVPWLALRIDGKKLAAGLGLAAVAVYLLISGWPPPAQRAAITASVAFGAILAGRQAISLHALAVAALIILALQPEAALAPGFQMSFAATAALVALAEAWPRPLREISAPWWIRGLQGAGGWLAVSLAASFVAGLATGPIALQHFNRSATYGLVSNLVVAPLSSFVIMPFLALGAALTPLGLGKPFLVVAGWGIGAMDAVAHLFATAPGATFTVASAPAIALPLSLVGLMWLCLMRGWIRWLGLPLALAVNLWPRPPVPDIWVASDGAAAVVRKGERGVPLRPDSKLFAADLWMRRRGLRLGPDAPAVHSTMFDCDRRSCTPRQAGAASVAGWWWKRPPDAVTLKRLCASAEVIVIRARMQALARPPECAARLVLAGEDFAAGGAAELYRNGAGGWRVVWAQPLRGDRPWTRRGGLDAVP